MSATTPTPTPTPTSAEALRRIADEKTTSAEHLRKQYDQRCNTYPHTRFTAPVVALWEGHFALLMQARDLRKMADEIDPPKPAPTPGSPPATPSIHIDTHRVVPA